VLALSAPEQNSIHQEPQGCFDRLVVCGQFDAASFAELLRFLKDSRNASIYIECFSAHGHLFQLRVFAVGHAAHGLEYKVRPGSINSLIFCHLLLLLLFLKRKAFTSCQAASPCCTVRHLRRHAYAIAQLRAWLVLPMSTASAPISMA